MWLSRSKPDVSISLAFILDKCVSSHEHLVDYLHQLWSIHLNIFTQYFIHHFHFVGIIRYRGISSLSCVFDDNESKVATETFVSHRQNTLFKKLKHGSIIISSLNIHRSVHLMILNRWSLDRGILKSALTVQSNLCWRPSALNDHLRHLTDFHIFPGSFYKEICLSFQIWISDRISHTHLLD